MTPDDDSSVADVTPLYRRVHPNYVVLDENRNCKRVSSGAFKERVKEMSVHIGDVLDAAGRDPSELVEDIPHCLISITAGFVRHHSQVVVRSPTPEDESHGDVVGNKPKRTLRAFAEAAVWVVAPEGACADTA